MYNNSIKYVTLVTAVINVILSIVLGKYFALDGIIAATIISRMIYAWWKEPKLIFNEYFKESSKSYFGKYILRVGYMFIVLLIVNLISSYIKINNIYFCFIIKAVVTAVLTIILLVLPYLKNEVMIYLRKIVKKG